MWIERLTIASIQVFLKVASLVVSAKPPPIELTVDIIWAKLKASHHLHPPSVNLILDKERALGNVVAKAHPDNRINELIKESACWTTAAAEVRAPGAANLVPAASQSHLGSADLCDSTLTWFSCPKCLSYLVFLHQDDSLSRLEYPASQQSSGGIHNSLLVSCRHLPNTTARWFPLS